MGGSKRVRRRSLSAEDKALWMAAFARPADVEAALDSGLLRFGVHVIGWGDGGSEAFVTQGNMIPSPLAGMMGAVGLGAIGARRRRA